MNIAKFLRTPFLQKTSVGCFWNLFTGEASNETLVVGYTLDSKSFHEGFLLTVDSCDEIHTFQRIWSHFVTLKKSATGKLHFLCSYRCSGGYQWNFGLFCLEKHLRTETLFVFPETPSFLVSFQYKIRTSSSNFKASVSLLQYFSLGKIWRKFYFWQTLISFIFINELHMKKFCLILSTVRNIGFACSWIAFPEPHSS